MRILAAASLLFLTACGPVAVSAADEPMSGYSIDALKMVDACKDGQPVYWTPNGAYWTWRGGWTRVAAHTGTAC